MIKVTTTWHNAGPHTIWARLAARLGREPTNAEAAQEVRRILNNEPGTSKVQDMKRIAVEALKP